MVQAHPGGEVGFEDFLDLMSKIEQKIEKRDEAEISD